MEKFTKFTVEESDSTNVLRFTGRERGGSLAFEPDTMGNMVVRELAYEWSPQPDITTYELALCWPALISPLKELVEELPRGARRHFKRIPGYWDDR